VTVAKIQKLPIDVILSGVPRSGTNEVEGSLIRHMTSQFQKHQRFFPRLRRGQNDGDFSHDLLFATVTEKEY
jgi:hypothetical protein